MKILIKVIFFITIIFTFKTLTCQENHRNYFLEWTVWTVFQTIPSINFFDDRNNFESNSQIGLKWEITPISYSFNMNRYVSKWNFFKVTPIKRHSGSVEIAFQTYWALSEFQNSDFKRFGISAGIRSYIPLIEYGEYLSCSFGVNYNRFSKKDGNAAEYPSVEFSTYTLFGFIGARVNYNFFDKSKYNIGINIKFY